MNVDTFHLYLRARIPIETSLYDQSLIADRDTGDFHRGESNFCAPRITKSRSAKRAALYKIHFRVSCTFN